jgi:uncharacterized membrane protein YphA (DoxX/SURF4 family)
MKQRMIRDFLLFLSPLFLASGFIAHGYAHFSKRERCIIEEKFLSQFFVRIVNSQMEKNH